jgi:hypothetical protein
MVKTSKLMAMSDAVIDRITPLLAGHGPRLQGIVLAELLGMWLAGHDADMEEILVNNHFKAARQFAELFRNAKRRKA